MNDLERRLKDTLEADAAKAPTVPRAPQGLKRDVRRRQIGTALVGAVAIVAVLGGSVAGLRAIDRSEGTTPLDDPWAGYEVFERTAKIENFTITSPSDLYLVNQWPWTRSTLSAQQEAADGARDRCSVEPKGPERRACVERTYGPGMGTVLPIFQLSTDDLGLKTSPCDERGVSLSPNGAVLTVALDMLSNAANFGAGDEPPWPVAYTEDSGFDRLPCGPGTYVPFASPESDAGSYPYLAHFAFGDQVSDEDRQAMIDAFESMQVDTIDDFVEGMFSDQADRDPRPAYVLAGGNNAAGTWTLEIRQQTSPGYAANVQLRLITADGPPRVVGGPIRVPMSPIDYSAGDPTFGAVTLDAASVELRQEGETDGAAASIVPLPPSLPFDFNIFFGGYEADVPPNAVPLDASGTPITGSEG